MRECKEKKALETQAETERQEKKALEGAWNQQRVRAGDMVSDGPSSSSAMADGGRRHANQWLMDGVLRAAYQQVGQKKTVRYGIDSVDHELAVMSTVAGVGRCLQETWLSETIESEIAVAQRCPFINRFYDCTPVRLTFGRLQSTLMPLARYHWWDKDLQQWESLTMDQYRQRTCKPQMLLRSGTVDIMATGADVTWVTPTLESRRISSLCAPQVVQRSNASTLHTALESAIPALDHSSIKQLAERCPWVVLNEQPDACSANGRRQLHAMGLCEEIPNTLHHCGKCGAHQCQRIIETTCRGSCGDAHAVGEACSNVSHGVKLQAAFRARCENAYIVRGPPIQANTERNKRIVQATLLRRAEFICQDWEDDAPQLHRQRLNDGCAKFLNFWNGNWTNKRIEHFCPRGCGPLGLDSECHEALFNSGCEVDLLCSKDGVCTLAYIVFRAYLPVRSFPYVVLCTYLCAHVCTRCFAYIHLIEGVHV